LYIFLGWPVVDFSFHIPIFTTHCFFHSKVIWYKMLKDAFLSNSPSYYNFCINVDDGLNCF
jgi:hypothetical protein